MSRIERPRTAFAGQASPKKRPRDKNTGHLDFIRSLPCLVTGRHGVEAAHVRYPDLRYGKAGTGMGEKPDDVWSVPLHADEHRRQHSMSEAEYWRSVGIDPLPVALSLYHVGQNEALALEVIKNARQADE